MNKEIDLGSMSAKEIIEKVEAGEIDSREYDTPGKYLKAMEE